MASFKVALWLSCVLVMPLFADFQSTGNAAESTEQSIALYADAANFQTGGAIELAIDNWKKFLAQYPDDDLAPKAAHYLGVCLMQKEMPDYVAAANAFATALEDNDYELREESLANQGWCYYAATGDGPQRDPVKLKRTLETFEQLRKENPKSDYIDRAYFYSGEAAYGLGDQAKAVQFYNAFLKLPKSKESPLKCDALYARGIAYEEMKKTDQAVASFQEMLQACGEGDLVVDVHLRLGDLYITNRDYSNAVSAFDKAIGAADDDTDKSYGVFRQAYALVQDGKPNEAAARYDRLQSEFPNSPYAANATLASGQSLYRGGAIDQAADRFRKVLSQKNSVAATEAAHWLVRILLSKNEVPDAIRVAQEQLASGAEGDFEVDLKVDLAEALSRDPQRIAESIEVAEKAYRGSPQDPLAPRALYNAAFSALQVNQFDQSEKLASEFLRQYPSDPLAVDVRYVVAESQLLTGKTREAISNYQQLINASDESRQQRPIWVLRCALAMNSAKAYGETIKLIEKEYPTIKFENQKAEAQFVLGQAHLLSGSHAAAAAALQRALSVDSNFKRAAEAKLLLGNALLSSGDSNAAAQTWQELIKMDGASRMADQARYKLAQAASNRGDHSAAVVLYEQIISANRDQGLLPYALYGRGWSLMQEGSHQKAVESLSKLLALVQDHPLSDDALIARGISYRTLGEYEDAKSDLQKYLGLKPVGLNLGHALYELALVDQKQKRPGEAAKRLQQLIAEVPEYSGMEKVLYELGWSQREAGEDKQAVETFRKLLQRYPEAPLVSEAAYFVGQQSYNASDWATAAMYYRIAADKANDPVMGEKALYRLGWAMFKESKFDAAKKAFADQTTAYPDGQLAIDARMMVGECLFKEGRYEEALASYAQGRKTIQNRNENSNSIRDAAERQVRELILLHGGQSAAQLKRWEEAIGWYDELKARFPSSAYRPQIFYETGFAYQQKGDTGQALTYFGQVADEYRRREVGARARFMMGEIYFGQKQFDKAIPEFQSVMFGFGGEDAPDSIKNWQAKSGFEAARCSELLMQMAKTSDAKQRSRKFASQFYEYVVKKHAGHELAGKSAARLEALK